MSEVLLLARGVLDTVSDTARGMVHEGGWGWRPPWICGFGMPHDELRPFHQKLICRHAIK